VQYVDEAWQKAFGRVLSDVIGTNAHSLWAATDAMPVAGLLQLQMSQACFKCSGSYGPI
jgi:hypothetical protein